VRSYEAEVIRLRGEILLTQSRGNAAAVETAFRQAMTVATRQSNRAIELRAGTSLAQLLADGGRRDEARDLLAPIYGRFTEGFDRTDLVAAKTLLAQLSKG
jgi:predicted ATPase